MPELPDVEVFRRYFTATALRQSITDVDTNGAREMLADISGADLIKRLRGRMFSETRRRGKHLFAKLNGGDWVVFHFGMTGALKYYKRPSLKPEHTRLTIRFENGYNLAYNSKRRLGQISLIDGPEQFVRSENLGPDALDGLTQKAFEKLVSEGRGMVKSLLMNQKKIAGIGNVYSDEILYQSRMHPRTKLKEIENRPAVEIIYKTIRSVLREAIDAGADPENMPKHFVTRHRQNAGICPRCGGTLENIKVVGRTSTFCPDCQVT